MRVSTIASAALLIARSAAIGCYNGFIDLFCRGYATLPRSIDINDTDDLVHGGKQLGLFNTHAGGHCFQPIHIFEATSGKPILSLLRPGKRPGKPTPPIPAHGAYWLLHSLRLAAPR
jgi:Transposase DDE domain group 1